MAGRTANRPGWSRAHEACSPRAESAMRRTWTRRRYVRRQSSPGCAPSAVAARRPARTAWRAWAQRALSISLPRISTSPPTNSTAPRKSDPATTLPDTTPFGPAPSFTIGDRYPKGRDRAQPELGRSEAEIERRCPRSGQSPDRPRSDTRPTAHGTECPVGRNRRDGLPPPTGRPGAVSLPGAPSKRPGEGSQPVWLRSRDYIQSSTPKTRTDAPNRGGSRPSTIVTAITQRTRTASTGSGAEGAACATLQPNTDTSPRHVER